MDFLQLIGTAAILTLAAVCLVLSLPKNYVLFVATGQAVYGWCFLVLVLLFGGRLLSVITGLSTDTLRPLNSAMFVICVLGIVISIATKIRRKEP